MKIWHRVAFNGDIKHGFSQAIELAGIKYKISPLPHHKVGLIYFDIDESDSAWNEVEELIRKYGASDVYQTTFDNKEILASEWLRLIPTFQQGYPQPEET